MKTTSNSHDRIPVDRDREAAEDLARRKARFFARSRQRFSYNVAPRYTPGSPALVDEALALRVAHDEREAYESALRGGDGVRAQERAKALGLANIAYAAIEWGSGRKARWLRWDLILDIETRWLNHDELRRLGYTGYMQLGVLPDWAYREIMARAPWYGGRISDLDRNWYHIVGSRVEVYEPELVTE